MRVNYIIIFVSDMKRSINFYRDVLGFPLKYETPEWTEFESEGTTVALHISEQNNPDQKENNENVAGRCRPGFSVADLDALHDKLISQGTICIQQPKESFGARIAQYLDPDGLAVSISETGGKGE
jgi:lactoylglutathione lyase